MASDGRSEALDVLTVGRISVDVYPLEDGPLENVTSFSKQLGGSATNVAVAAARLGEKSAVITRIGDDPFGRYLRAALDEFGVETAFVKAVPGLQTPVAFCEIYPPDNFPLYFYGRKPLAPDLAIEPHELDLVAIATARVFWATATGLSAEPSRSAHYAAWEARGRAPLTILDLDYREMFWSDEVSAAAEISRALDHVTVAVGNLEECRIAVGESDPDRAADALLERGLELAVVKQGPRGVLAKSREGRVVVPPLPAAVINGLGAGDGFGGALCHGLLAGWTLERVLRFANAAGAIVAESRWCSTAMPTAAEVESRMELASFE